MLISSAYSTCTSNSQINRVIVFVSIIITEVPPHLIHSDEKHVYHIWCTYVISSSSLRSPIGVAAMYILAVSFTIERSPLVNFCSTIQKLSSLERLIMY